VVNAFLRALGALGYVYGQHFVTEPSAGESKPRYTAVASEIVRDQVDVIVAAGPALEKIGRQLWVVRVSSSLLIADTRNGIADFILIMSPAAAVAEMPQYK
jgi:hypothetical protein